MKSARLFTALTLAAAGTFGAIAIANTGASEYGPALDSYFGARAALASDDLAKAQEAAKQGVTANVKVLQKDFKSIADATDLKAARLAFGDLTKDVMAFVKATTEKGAKLPAIHVFHCPMAKPYGTWLQESEDMGNPYYGASMLKCGKKTGQLTGEGAGGAGGESSEGGEGKKGGGCCPGH